jgi:hypothetical protein
MDDNTLNEGSAAQEQAVDTGSLMADVLKELGLPAQATEDTDEGTTPETEQSDASGQAPGQSDATDEAEPQTEGETEAEEAEEAEGEEPADKDEKKDKVQKRIDELTAMRKQAEEKSQAAESRVAELEKTVATLHERMLSAVQPADPFGLHTAADDAALQVQSEKLDAEIERWETVLDSREEKDKEGNLLELTPEREKQIKSFVREARKALEKGVPARKQFFAERAKFTNTALAKFPWLKDQKSEQYRYAQSIGNAFPDLAASRFAPWAYVLGIVTEWEMAAEKQAKAAQAAKPAAAAKAPPKMSAPAASAPVVRSPQAKARAAGSLRDKALKSGSLDDLEKYVESTL